MIKPIRFSIFLLYLNQFLFYYLFYLYASYLIELCFPNYSCYQFNFCYAYLLIFLFLLVRLQVFFFYSLSLYFSCPLSSSVCSILISQYSTRLQDSIIASSSFLCLFHFVPSFLVFVFHVFLNYFQFCSIGSYCFSIAQFFLSYFVYSLYS